MAPKRWAPWFIIGAMLVMIAFGVGLYRSSVEASYFTNSKIGREAAGPGLAIARQKVTKETIKTRPPAFKFLGMGFIRGDITFLLATILGTLRVAGGMVQQAWAWWSRR